MVTALFLLLAVLGSQVSHGTVPASSGFRYHVNTIPTYVSLIAAEWALVYSIWKAGLGRGAKLADLIGRIPRGTRLLQDVGFGLLVFACWTGWLVAQANLLPDRQTSIQSFLPRSSAEVLFWVALAISAGICEEIVFRGYLQHQFEALIQSRWVAVVAQAALFGAAHVYEGGQASTTIMAYGLILGALAGWRRNLAPGIIAHVGSDLLPLLLPTTWGH